VKASMTFMSLHDQERAEKDKGKCDLELAVASLCCDDNAECHHCVAKRERVVITQK
jgi:hypothetical protein